MNPVRPTKRNPRRCLLFSPRTEYLQSNNSSRHGFSLAAMLAAGRKAFPTASYHQEPARDLRFQGRGIATTPLSAIAEKRRVLLWTTIATEQSFAVRPTSVEPSLLQVHSSTRSQFP